MKHSTTTHYEEGSWKEAFHDVYGAILVGAAHPVYFAKDFLHGVVAPLRRVLGKSHETEPLEVDGESNTIKVLGVGYGRTGTYSLTLALDELGFPTLHTQHMYELPEIFDMWTEKVFLPSVESGEVTMGSPDFNVIASNGFTATMDLPMALYFEEVRELYPDCKFILTTREDSEIWFKSWDTLTKSIANPTQFGCIIPGVRKLEYYIRWLFSVVGQDEMFLKAPYPIPSQNKDLAIKSYESHNKRVREVIPSDLLLEYNVNDGWQPLCDFLEVADCPTTPFPKSNSARSVQVQAISAMITPLIVVLFILFYLFSAVFQRVTGRTVVKWITIKRRQVLDYLSGASRGQKRMTRTVHLKAQ